MLKMLIFLSTSIFLTTTMNMYMLILSMIIMYAMLFLMKNYSMQVVTNIFILDPLSTTLILLSLFTTVLIVMSANMTKESKITLTSIMILLMFTFSISKTILFYIFFELVLIPTLILITKKGPQPERLQAGMYLILYTILASLPLLIGILYFKSCESLYDAPIMLKKINIPLIFMLAFLAKTPMFFVHLWLPKAHVEAPLEGSMVLAAILLKLGGYGIIRFVPMSLFSLKMIPHWIISISFMGAIFTSTGCVRQKDLKALIAYSSVAHMAITLSSIMIFMKTSINGAILMMIAHGISSSALFFLVNMTYMKFNTRNVISLKSIFMMNPNLTFWWFMFTMANISAPPTLNLMGELLMSMTLIKWHMLSIMFIFMSTLATTTFCILMFLMMNHGKTMLKKSNMDSTKFFLSLMIHLTLSILVILKMELMSMLFISLTKTTICGIVMLIINFLAFTLMIFIAPMMMMMSFLLLKNFIFISMEIPIFINDFWNMKISFIMDWTSLSFSTTVMLISSMILLYSMSYIPENEHKQFMLIMMMFVLSMILLINSNNLIFMLLGWDGLGISSYMLVILYQNPKSGASGSITVLSNRIGDALIIISISLMFMTASWSFFMIQMNSKLILILLLLASCTKSAQFPFSAWLPAAMAAPTPISALVHSSTLVTAGVFLMIRLIQYSNINILIVLVLLSSMTAIYASMTACWEQDMKKIIAFSTLSQIAMMMFSISLMNPNIAFFHLITHALFKSMMFMTAGVIIMSSSYQDMRHMGSMMKNTPIIASSMGISMMALMGLPFMSGFFSKDMILEMMLKSSFIQIMSFLMISSIGMTATYSIRTMKFTFKMLLKSKKDSTIKPNNFMEIPLMLMMPMGIMSGTFLSWISFPLQNYILPTNLKFSILITLLLGIILSMNTKYFSMKYMKMGTSAISIWFINMMSTMLMNKPMNPILKILNFDKNWQETYGPNTAYYTIKMLMFKPNQILSTPMFMMLILSMPITILMMMS